LLLLYCSLLLHSVLLLLRAAAAAVLVSRLRAAKPLPSYHHVQPASERGQASTQREYEMSFVINIAIPLLVVFMLFTISVAAAVALFALLG
jgi:hypothetical protein